MGLILNSPQVSAIPMPAPLPAASGPAAKNETLGNLLSPSQANQFLNCSARWWFKYGAGLPDPKGGSLVRGFIAMCHPSRRSSKLKAYGTWNSTANWT